jgi:AcrR family transcriptional regulator
VSGTRTRILDTARALFNENGLHRVGVREIARALEMSPGNLAYHFATKDDLVAALVLELSERNKNDAFGELPADYSLAALYTAAIVAMRRMLEYRFVLVSFTDALMSSPELRRLQASLYTKRCERYGAMLAKLVENDYVDGRAIKGRTDRIFEQGDIIASGWLGAAVRRGGPRGDRTEIAHYAKLGCALLEPYCTEKGARQMRKILSGALDDAAWSS